MYYTYSGCPNIYGNLYVLSNNINTTEGCFTGRDNSNIIRIYANPESASINIFLNDCGYGTLTTNNTLGYAYSSSNNTYVFYNAKYYGNMYRAYMEDRNPRIAGCSHTVTNMNEMFCSCESLISLDLSNFNTSKVVNTDKMFSSVPPLIIILVNSNSNTWTISESASGRDGSFTRI